jgi:endonuclease YncB( thermonuclease family)
MPDFFLRSHIEPRSSGPGSSDADTSKVKVSVDADSFAFAANGKTFRKTTVFKNASVIGASKKLVIDKNNKVTVRLQGIDAPELHYKAAPLKGVPG